MFSHPKRLYVHIVLLFLIFLNQASIYSTEQPPTVVFYVVYLFEARSNGEEVKFPLLPGETAVTTIESVIETSQGYIDKLRSIYSFPHLTLLTTMGGTFSINLEKNNGIKKTAHMFGKKKNVFHLYLHARKAPEEGLLPLRIEAHLETKGQGSQSAKRESLFKMLSSVKHGHPLVIGRSLPSENGRKRAIFVVFTPLFQQLRRADQYEEVIANYKKVLQLSASEHDLGGYQLFKKINHYFKTKLNRNEIVALNDIVPPPLEPPPISSTEDEIVFVPYDTPPEPIGGFVEIQKNLVYPKEIQKAGIEGKVIVWVRIDENGDVTNTKLHQSLEGCDRAAVDAIRSVKWKPAMYRDKPVKVWIAVPIDFKLK